MQTTQQFITSIKLKELQRQRAYLSEAYQAIQTNTQQATQPLEKLKVLYEGLSNLKFAGQRLHPNIENLDVLLAQNLTFSPHIVKLWLGKLQKELEQGQLRTEMICIFGTLLEEWIQDNTPNKELQQEKEQAEQHLWNETSSPSNAQENFKEIIDQAYKHANVNPDDIKKVDDLFKPVTQYELGPILDQIAGDIYQTASIRKEAQQIRNDDTLMKELTDALTILNANIGSWKWAEQVPVRILWTRNRWRLYQEEDLATLCFLETMGTRWNVLVESDATSVYVRQERIKRLKEINAPDIMLKNEQDMLVKALSETGLLFYSYTEDSHKIINAEESSVIAQRKIQHANLRSLLPSHGAAHGYGYSQNNHQVIALLNAEVQLHKAITPDAPLYIAKIDLKSFYASIPTEVVLYFLEKLNLPAEQYTFFEKYLSPGLTCGGQAHNTTKGVPMGHLLSDILAELLLRLMETYVGKSNHIQLIRKVDDMFLLTNDKDTLVQSWHNIKHFCSQCGLAFNDAKSGIVALNANIPVNLPAKPVKIGLLELNKDGGWQVNPEAFETHLKQTRKRVEKASSVFSAVQTYNANVRYLMQVLYPELNLGQAHRESIEQNILHFHSNLFDEGKGIIDHLKYRILQKYSSLPSHMEIPVAWFYWSLTAGGLGLQNPVLKASLYNKVVQAEMYKATPDSHDSNWDILDNDWADYYSDLRKKVEIEDPHKDTVMESLIEDFIARGNEISGGNQYGLTSYWQWVLFVYGSEILDSLGTFRYLITELVPLQLIFGQLNEDRSL